MLPKALKTVKIDPKNKETLKMLRDILGK